MTTTLDSKNVSAVVLPQHCRSSQALVLRLPCSTAEGGLCASIKRDFSCTRLIAALIKIGQSIAALGKTQDLSSA
jgi:hypothetical protein